MTRPALSLVIPAYNEERQIPRAMGILMGAGKPIPDGAEIIWVDDGSTDLTWELVSREASRHPHIRAVRLDANQGKGAALRAGLAHARGKTVVFMDADLPYPSSCIAQALSQIESGADVVIGARDLTGDGAGWRYSWFRNLASRGFHVLLAGLVSGDIRDTQCGFKAFRADAGKALFGALTIDGYAFDVELLLLAYRWELRVERMPVRMVRRTSSSTRFLVKGLQAVLDVWRIRGRTEQEWPRKPSHL